MSKEKQLFEKAETIYFKNSETRYIPAINAFKNLLTEYPKNVEGWLMMATMQSSIDDYDSAFRSYNKAIECDPTNIKSIEQKLRQLSILGYMDYSTPYFVDRTGKRRYKISSIPSRKELAELIIETIDLHLTLAPTDSKAYKLVQKKATQLNILGQKEEAISTYKRVLEMIPEDEKNGYWLFNPVNSVHNKLSKIYYDNKEYDLALEYFELTEQKEELTPSQLYKADLLMGLNRSEEATKTVDHFVEYLNQKLIDQPETAYFNQKISALIWLNEFDHARATISEFDVLKPYNDYIINNITQVTQEVDSAEEIYKSHENTNKFKHLKTRTLDNDEVNMFRGKDQGANELICWYYEMGEHHTDEKLLTGIGKVIASMKDNPQFPIAEYNNLRDITDLLGICFGEMLKNNFGWNWYYIEESDKGYVGYIIVSPDKKISILTEEYFYTRVFTEDNEDYIKLYQDLKNGIQFHWQTKEFKVLGNWKFPIFYDQIFKESQDDLKSVTKPSIWSRILGNKNT